MRLALIVTALAVLIGAMGLAGADTIVVDDDWVGADHDCIQDAINVSSTDDVIRVHAGVYSENITVDVSVSIVGNGSVVSIINGTGTGRVVYINVSGVEIANLTVTNSQNASAGIMIESDSNFVHGCNVSDNGDHGIIINGSYSYNRIENCTFSSNSVHGVWIDEGEDTHIANCTFDGNGDAGIDVDYISTYNTVRDCAFSNHTSGSHHSGVYMFASATHNEILFNTFRDDSYGVWLQSAGWNEIRNNSVDALAIDIYVAAYSQHNIVDGNICEGEGRNINVGTYADDNFISNNTLVNGTHGVYLSRSDDCIVENNTITDTGYGVYAYRDNNRLDVRYNHIVGNTNGVYNDDTIWIDAKRNWWGSYDGPSGDGSGSGDSVGDWVYYQPWYATNTTTPLREFVLVNRSVDRAYSDVIGVAIDVANPGDTVNISAGHYNETIELVKSIYLRGSGYPVINATDDHIVIVSADDCSIAGFNFIAQNSPTYGMSFENVTNCSFRDSDIAGCEYGVWLSGSDNVTIYDIYSGYNGYGFITWMSEDIEIIDSVHLWANYTGIEIRYSNRVAISGCRIQGSDEEGIHLYDSGNVTISRNNVSWNDQKNNGRGGIRVDKTGNVTVSNNEIWNNSRHGIQFWQSDNVEMIGNNITENVGHGIRVKESSKYLIETNNVSNNHQPFEEDYGVFLWDTTNMTLIGNEISFNYHGLYFTGTHLQNYSNNSSIIGNSISNNTRNGITTTWTYDVEIRGNNLSGNTGWGIRPASSEWFKITNNSIFENGDGGIEMAYSNNSVIAYNEIFDNSDYGLSIYPGFNNTIHHNNFIGNGESTSQGYNDGSGNVWDNGTHGNYWSDYNGTDSNGDGIGETPYALDNSGNDSYPLTNYTANSSPQKVPEFPIVTVMAFVVVVFAAVFRRRRLY